MTPPEYLTKEDAEDLVKRTVKETLISMGVDTSDPLEMQRDFQTLREFRCTLTAMRSKGLLTFVAIFIAGLISLVILGIKHGVFGK